MGRQVQSGLRRFSKNRRSGCVQACLHDWAGSATIQTLKGELIRCYLWSESLKWYSGIVSLPLGVWPPGLTSRGMVSLWPWSLIPPISRGSSSDAYRGIGGLDGGLSLSRRELRWRWECSRYAFGFGAGSSRPFSISNVSPDDGIICRNIHWVSQ
jgi:hypothetical protein